MLWFFLSVYVVIWFTLRPRDFKRKKKEHFFFGVLYHFSNYSFYPLLTWLVMLITAHMLSICDPLYIYCAWRDVHSLVVVSAKRPLYSSSNFPCNELHSKWWTRCLSPNTCSPIYIQCRLCCSWVFGAMVQRFLCVSSMLSGEGVWVNTMYFAWHLHMYGALGGWLSY